MDTTGSGSYDGTAFVKRVLDHIASQEDPPGGNPPTYAALQGKARQQLIVHKSKAPELKEGIIDTPQVSSVVRVPGKAKAAIDDRNAEDQR